MILYSFWLIKWDLNDFLFKVFDFPIKIFLKSWKHFILESMCLWISIFKVSKNIKIKIKVGTIVFIKVSAKFLSNNMYFISILSLDRCFSFLENRVVKGVEKEKIKNRNLQRKVNKVVVKNVYSNFLTYKAYKLF